MGAELGATVAAGQGPAQVRGAVSTPRSGSPKRRSGWCCRAAGEVAGAAGAVRRRGRRGDGDRHVRGDGPAEAAAIRANTVGRPRHALPARRPARRRASRRSYASRAASATRRDRRPLADARGDCSRRPPQRILASLQRLQQGMDHPPVRPRGAGRQRRQAAGRRRERRPVATRRSSCRCSARGAAWRSAAASTRATATSTRTAMAAARHRRGGAERRRRRRRPERGSPSSTTSAGATSTDPEVLGSLVRAAEACRDVALAFGTPFISGKDSLNNEYRAGRPATTRHPAHAARPRAGPGARRAPVRDDGPEGAGQRPVPGRRDDGRTGRLALPPRHRADRRRRCRRVDLELAPKLFAAVHAAITQGLVRACHDLSEGGLAVALAEMAFAGGVGADVTDLKAAAPELAGRRLALFSESPTRFVLEVKPAQRGGARRRSSRACRWRRSGRR